MLVPLRAKKTFKRNVWARLYSFEYTILFTDPEVSHVHSVDSGSATSSVSLTMPILPLLLHLIVICFSKKIASLNLHPSGLRVFPATLNSLSTGADVTEIDRYLDANFYNTQKRSKLNFQKSMGLDFIQLQGSAK